jgi:hypothetical protein
MLLVWAAVDAADDGGQGDVGAVDVLERGVFPAAGEVWDPGGADGAA